MAKGKRKTKSLTLSPFDRDVLQAVARGLTVQQFIASFNLDPAHASKRVSVLEAADLLVRDPVDQNRARLTPGGYEKLTKLAEKEKAKQAREQAKAAQREADALARNAAPAPTTSGSSTPQSPNSAFPNQPSAAPAPASPPVETAPPALPSIPASALIRRTLPSREKAEAVDYVELLQEQQKLAGKRPARKTRAIPALSQSAQTTASPPTQTSARAPAKTPEESVENCELCKSDFKLSVSDSSTGLYGHCFCGAPYHKDCYDALLETGESKCVRCGKRLALMLDSQSEDAVKGVKKLYD